MNKTFVIVPCYNEAGSVIATLTHLREVHPDFTIVAVNDGSTDNTLQCLRSIEDEKLIVIDLPFNSGIGTAVQTGLLYAERNGARYAIKFDGDGQHLAEEIELLLAPLTRGEADLVAGSRFLTPDSDGFKSTLLRRAGIRLFYFLTLILTGKGISDCTSGFRAYNRTALEFAARHYPYFDYPEPEESILFLRNNFEVKEVPCKMAVRQSGSSSIHSWKAFYFMFKVSFSMIMGRFRPVIRGR
jgi:glycosyltransferase involved in cell wall biosynthesis